MAQATGNSKALAEAEQIVFRCTFNCKSEFQDKKYGFGMRVHRPAKKGYLTVGDFSYRCTVCQPDSKTRKVRAHALNHIKAQHG